MIELKNLIVGYPQGFKTKMMNVELAHGDVSMIMGLNGTGKTTLLKTILGLVKPLSGKVLIDGKDIHAESLTSRARLVSYVQSNLETQTDITALEFLQFTRFPHVGLLLPYRKQDSDIVDKVAFHLKIENFLDKPVSQLSDGQKKRILVGRALVQDTPVILLDEPSAHLDLASKLEVMTILMRLCFEFNKTVLIVDHFWDMSLMYMPQMWLLKRHGELRVGAPEDFLMSGEIEETFSFENHHLDKETGLFSVGSIEREINVEGPNSKWCKSYLNKCCLDLKLIDKIVANENDYQIIPVGKDAINCSSLLELSQKIRALSEQR